MQCCILLPQEKKATWPRNLRVSGLCFTCTDSQRGTGIILVDHSIEAFPPAQEGTCGEVKGVKKKGGKKGFSFLSAVQRVNIQHKQQVHCFEWCQPLVSVTSLSLGSLGAWRTGKNMERWSWGAVCWGRLLTPLLKCRINSLYII